MFPLITDEPIRYTISADNVFFDELSRLLWAQYFVRFCFVGEIIYSIATKMYSCPPVPGGVIPPITSIPQAENGQGELYEYNNEGGTCRRLAHFWQVAQVLTKWWQSLSMASCASFFPTHRRSRPSGPLLYSWVPCKQPIVCRLKTGSPSIFGWEVRRVFAVFQVFENRMSVNHSSFSSSSAISGITPCFDCQWHFTQSSRYVNHRRHLSQGIGELVVFTRQVGVLYFWYIPSQFLQISLVRG